MKIAYILNSTIQANGANVSFWEMLSGVMEYGVVPLVVCPDQYDFYYFLKDRGITVMKLNYRPATWYKLYQFSSLILFIQILALWILGLQPQGNSVFHTILLTSYYEYCKHTGNPLKLLIAGSAVGDKYISQQKEYVHMKGLSGMVEFLGEISDMDKLMQNAKATVVPSLNEGFGRVMPEAMFTGCPVIDVHSILFAWQKSVQIYKTQQGGYVSL